MTLPVLHEEWPRSCARVISGALDYAVGLIHGDRAAVHRAQLELALVEVAQRCGPDAAALADADGSVFERSSAVLVWSRQHDHADGELARSILHPVLLAQLEEEAAAAEPLLTALHVAMRGNEQPS